MKLLPIWKSNMMIFLPKNPESSVILDSAITVSMLSYISSHLLVMRKVSILLVCVCNATNRLYSLREIDIELMRRLSPRVNVIPVVGRADSLTPQELKDFKRRVSILYDSERKQLLTFLYRSWKTLNITIFPFITSLTMLRKTKKIPLKKTVN